MLLKLVLAEIRNHKKYLLYNALAIAFFLMTLFFRHDTNEKMDTSIFGFAACSAFMVQLVYKYQGSPVFQSLPVKTYLVAISRTIISTLYAVEIFLVFMIFVFIDFMLSSHNFGKDAVNFNSIIFLYPICVLLWHTLWTVYYDVFDIKNIRKSSRNMNWKVLVFIVAIIPLSYLYANFITNRDISFEYISNPLSFIIAFIISVSLTIYSFCKKKQYFARDIKIWGVD